MNMFKVILLSWTLSIFTTFQWYYDFVIINLSFHRSVLLRTTIYVKQDWGDPGELSNKESWSTLFISKLAAYLTCSSYSKCINIILIQRLFY